MGALQRIIVTSENQSVKNSVGVNLGDSAAAEPNRFDHPGNPARAASKIKQSDKQTTGLTASHGTYQYQEYQ